MVAENKYTFRLIGVDETSVAFKQISANIRKTINLAGAFGAGAAAGLGVMIANSTKAATEMTRLGRTVGVGAQTMSEWSHAAETVNIQSDKMADIFKDVSEKIGDFASTGGGEAGDVFKKLGLDVKDFVNLSPDQQILKIGNALDDVESRSEKIFILESLASDASNLLPLLEDNAKGLRGLQEEAQRFGTSISDVDAAKLEAANRSMERVQAIGEGLGNQISATLAPIVEDLAEQFIGVATEGDNMGKFVARGFEIGGKVAGTLANGVRGIHIGFKGLEVTAKGLNFVLIGGFVKFIEIMGDVSKAIVDGLVKPIRSVFEIGARFGVPGAEEALSQVKTLVDGIRIQAPAAMTAFADAQAEAFSYARGELHDLLMLELPSNVIEKNIDEVMARAEDRMQERVAEISRGLGTESDEDADNNSDATTKLAREQVALQRRLEMLDQSYFTELERLQAKLDTELALLTEAREKEALTEEQFRQKRARAEAGHEKAMLELKKKSEDSKQKLTAQGMLQQIQGINIGSRKIFGIQKTAAIASTALNLPKHVAETMSAYPFPLSVAMGVLAAGQSLAQINSVKSQSFGSGAVSTPSLSGAGSVGIGATPRPPGLSTVGSVFGQPNQDREPRTTIIFNGDLIGDKAQAIFDEFKTMIEDTDAVLITPGSRQAQELSG